MVSPHFSISGIVPAGQWSAAPSAGRTGGMQPGRTVLAQLMDHVTRFECQTCVARYDGEYKVSRFSCWDQYLCMAFAQLTYRESLCDVEAWLRALQSKLYHVGIRERVSQSTLANANETRHWRIYADLTQGLIHTARALYLDVSLYKLLQVLPLTLFEIMPISPAIFDTGSLFEDTNAGNQFRFFNL